MGGMIAVNLLLRDKSIIPQMYVQVGLAGFMLVMLYGMYCIAKCL